MTTFVDPIKEKYTEKQGQYLAFIYQYTKINNIPPAHADIQNYFKVTPPTVNQMLKTLENKSFIFRQPRTPRSIKILIPAEQLPMLK